MLGLDRTRVELVAHHDAWREAFETEAARLRDALGDRMRAVEHVGSTAVPGVPAKPVLDLLVTVPPAGDDGLARARDCHPTLASLGYERRETDVPGRTFLVRGPPDARTHYLSVAPHGGEFHREKIAFREYLREHPSAAERYADRKRELAARYPDDRDAYTEGKNDLIARLLDEALPDYGPDATRSADSGER